MLPGNNMLDVEGAPQPTRSCWLLQELTGFRLPVGEKIANVHVRFQFRFFFTGQRALVRFGVELFDTGGILLGKVEREYRLGKRSRHTVSGQIEYPLQHFHVRPGAKCL